jgi:hypothetical protein
MTNKRKRKVNVKKKKKRKTRNYGYFTISVIMVEKCKKVNTYSTTMKIENIKVKKKESREKEFQIICSFTKHTNEKARE